MKNGQRTEVYPFQGSWTANLVNRESNRRKSGAVNPSELKQVFEEIESDLSHFSVKKNSSAKKQKPEKTGARTSSNPLILRPPVIKDVDLKQTTGQKKLFRENPEEESSEIEEHENEVNSGKLTFSEESSDSLILNEESPEHLLMEIESSELFIEESSEEFPAEERQIQEERLHANSNEDLTQESESMPLKIADLLDETDAESEEISISIEPRRIIREHERQSNNIKVKLPIHLAHVNLEVDLFDTFNLPKQISYVSRVEWSIHSIDIDVLLPSVNLFSKGILLLDLEYVCDNDSGTHHGVKIHVPWKKIMPVKWILPPELSFNQSKEYMFTTREGSDPSYHREFSEKSVEKLDFQLSNLNCTWNEQFINREKVLIQGTANMQIDIFQKQCRNLRELMSLLEMPFY